MTSPTVLVLHAHPDDEAIFTGATIRRLADSGVRVVLVTATDGDLGESFVDLADGETVAGRRHSEVEQAAAILGVERTVFLGLRDSGLPGDPDNAHPDALAAADVERVAADVAALAVSENAGAIVHYDSGGIYRHPDHLAVHRIGTQAAARLGLTSYEATVDHDHLARSSGRRHLIHDAAQAANSPFGLSGNAIDISITATRDELEAKRAAIDVHASQIRTGFAENRFAEGYGREWFVRHGPLGVIDDLADTSDLVASRLTVAHA